MAKCWKCEQVEIEEPAYCCSDSDGMCGCRGYPIHPPYCDACMGSEIYFEKPKEASQ